ncbi:MAG TPA: sulfite exporter TauE/SafE family protein [Gaiella sp.]|nr:sulfite exporter TauE/SafE family protein [Gaiella sp.]
MSGWTIAAALALGFGAGVLSGVFGVGGGILFVPTLVLLGLGQVEASATSLLAIVPTAAAGAVRQRAYGNLRVRAALVLGVVSVAGAELGVQVATRIDESLLRRLFGVLLLVVAARLLVQAVRGNGR